MNVTIGRNGVTNRLCQFRQDVWLAVVGNRVDRVEAQPVKVIFRQPIECIVNEKVTHSAALRAVEVYAVAPRSLVPVGKELGRVAVEVIPFRTEVVVNHVEENHESAFVSALHKLFKIFGPAITRVGSKRIDAVITPVSLAWKVG